MCKSCLQHVDVLVNRISDYYGFVVAFLESEIIKCNVIIKYYPDSKKFVVKAFSQSQKGYIERPK